MRILVAGIVGLAIAAASALVLGDYPVSGAVPWLAAVIIPFLIGGAMALVVGGQHAVFWWFAGPVAAAAMLWGIRIASDWGADPVPTATWIAVGFALLWPFAWAAVVSRRSPSP